MGWVKATMRAFERRNETERQLDRAALEVVRLKMNGPAAKAPNGIIPVSARELRVMTEHQRLNFGKLD